MKPLLATIVLSVLISCSNSSSFKKSTPDTTKTVAVYTNRAGALFIDYVVRVASDSFMLVSTDTTTSEVVSKRKWVRDTSYFVPLVDTLRDAANKPVLDSNGKSTLRLWWVPSDKKYIIQDFNKAFPVK
jgi:hypothetical protein